MHDDLQTNAHRVQKILQDQNIDTQVIQFQESTRTAQEAADAIGCQVGQIAKTLIFRGKLSGKPICVIASGSNRVDEKKIEKVIGEPVEKPDADYVMKHTGFAIGGVSPVGYHFDTKPLIDEDLMHYKEIWAAAGTPNAVFNLTPHNLIALTMGNVVTVKMQR